MNILHLYMLFEKNFYIHDLNLNIQNINGLNESKIIFYFACPAFIYFSSDKSTLIFPNEKSLHYFYFQ